MRPTILLSTFLAFALAPLAAAQQYPLDRNGQKLDQPVQYDRNGKPVTGVPVILPPSAPLVGGADSCVTPDVVTGTGAFAFDNTAATRGTEGQAEALCLFFGFNSINADVWFTWTATATGLATVTSCGLTTVDTKIAIYNGNTCPTGAAIACNDDSCAGLFQSTLTFSCTAGNSYVIQLGISDAPPPATVGTGTFSISVIVPSGNDDCSMPVNLVGTGPFPFDNTTATAGSQGQAEGLCLFFGSTIIPRDLWYTWTATFSGVAAVRTCGQTTVDTKIAVYNGSGCPGAGAIGCNDDACGTLQTETLFPCTSGQTYTFQLGLYQGTQTGGTGNFLIADASPPANDACTSPTTVVGTGPFPFNNTYATTGTQGQTEVLCGAGTAAAIPKDVWFTWNATFTGTAGVSTCSTTTVNTKVAVYAGNTCPAAAALGCNDNFCTNQSLAMFACTAGQDYLIQLGLNSGGTVGGTGTFSIVVATPPANDDCSAATSLAGLGLFPFDNTFSTTGTQGQTETLCGAGAAAAIPKDVWFTWNATVSGPVAVSTLGNGNTLNTKIAVYDGAGCPAAAAIACNDTVTVVQAMAVFTAVAGQDYTFQLGLNSGGTASGTGTLEIMSATPPANDDCALPVTLSGSGPYPFNTYFCTTGTAGQSGGACTFTNGINFDQWFLWTPTLTGSVTISTCAGTVGQPSNDTKLAAYPAAPGCPANGTALACNDDATCPGGISTFNSSITFSTTCGTQYLIQVGRYIATTAPIKGLFTIVETGTTCNPAVAYCFGDGTGTACPCQNAAPPGGTGPIAPGLPGNGCPNSLNPNGANLAASGLGSVGSDSVALIGTGMPNSTCLYFQGNAQIAGGLGSAFGDGLRCVTTGVIRLGTKTNVGGTSQYPVGGDMSVSVKGLVNANDVKHYQCWYRNSALFCVATSTFNLTNALTITWAP